MALKLKVLEACDFSRMQWNYIITIIIAGMGFFTDAYNRFCISTASKLLGRLYYYDTSTRKPGKLPENFNNAVIGVALIGTLTGHPIFGWIADKLGCKRAYNVTLIVTVICAICSGLSFGASKETVIGTLCFFRFWLGLGISGDYC